MKKIVENRNGVRVQYNGISAHNITDLDLIAALNKTGYQTPGFKILDWQFTDISFNRSTEGFELTFSVLTLDDGLYVITEIYLNDRGANFSGQIIRQFAHEAHSRTYWSQYLQKLGIK